MTALLNVTGAVSQEFLDALNANFQAIDAKLDQLLGLWVTKAANYTAVVGNHIDADTSGGSFTVTLPSILAEEDRVGFNDFAGSWATNPLTIDPNGHEFEDAGDGSNPAEPMICDEPAQFELVYAGGKLRVR